MTRKCIGGAILYTLLVGTTGCDKLSSLTAKGSTPEQLCSAQSTDDALTGIMAAGAGQAVSLLGSNAELSVAASRTSFARVLQYTQPTVAGVNKDTRRINCEAILTVNTPTQLLTTKSDVPVNDFGPDHVSYQISYTVQPSADGGKDVYTLTQASDLAGIALQASLIAARKLQAASKVPDVDINTADRVDNEDGDTELSPAGEPAGEDQSASPADDAGAEPTLPPTAPADTAPSPDSNTTVTNRM